VLRLDFPALSNQNTRPFYYVSQFPYVTRPSVRSQKRRRLGADHDVVGAEFREKALGQQVEVLHAVPQGAQLDRKDGKSIIEIFPKIMLLDTAAKVRVGRGNHASIYAKRIAAAQPLDFPLFQKPQQLGLQP